MRIRARSQTPFAAHLLQGPVIDGRSLGHGHLLFGRRVLSLTRPGALRLPNGLECDLSLPATQAPVRIGAGKLDCDGGTVLPGPLWEPRPCLDRCRFAVSTDPGPWDWSPDTLIGRGPGLTPLGDDVLAGYLAARALFRGINAEDAALAAALAGRTTSLSGTLLRLAAQGRVPEAAHRLLEEGDPSPLLAWGASSGSGLLAGLGLYVAATGSKLHRALDLMLPFDPPCAVRIDIRRITNPDGAPH